MAAVSTPGIGVGANDRSRSLPCRHRLLGWFLGPEPSQPNLYAENGRNAAGVAKVTGEQCARHGLARLLWRIHEASPDGDHDGMGPILGAELAHDALHSCLDGIFSDE